MPVCVRAGGGSGGGGSGGGGGSSHHFHYHHNGSSSSSSMDGIIFATTFIGTGILLHVLSNESYYKAVYRSRKELKERNLDAKAMYKQMAEKYYIIQQAWSDVDLDTLKKECSPQLYDQWRVKLEWQGNRNERNVLENIRLIRMRIVKVNKKSVWVYVKGKMKDSIIDTNTGDVKEYNGSSFIEYWRFELTSKGFRLSSIKQRGDYRL